MMLLPIKIIIPKDLEEIPHNRGAEAGECLPANRDRFILIISRIVKNDPKQNVISFAGSRSSLLDSYSLL